MEKIKITAKAPASLMLMGEHSVLYGYPAFGIAVAKYLTISLTAEFETYQNSSRYKDTFDLKIYSKLGNVNIKINPRIDLKAYCSQNIIEKFDYLLYSIQEMINLTNSKHLSNLQIYVNSCIPLNHGYGSSAALISAILTAFNAMFALRLTKKQLWQLGKKIIIKASQYGSGADLAFCLYGGITCLQKHRISSLQTTIKQAKILVLYSGYKTKTKEVVAKVAESWKNNTKELEKIYATMGKLTQQAIAKLQNNKLELKSIANELNSYQKLMIQLGVSDKTLSEIDIACQKIINDAARNRLDIYAGKISGSGLGDCYLGFYDANMDKLTESSYSNLSYLTQYLINAEICQYNTNKKIKVAEKDSNECLTIIKPKPIQLDLLGARVI